MLVLLLGGAAACSAPDALVFGSGGGAGGSGGAGSASHAASSGTSSSSSSASSSGAGAGSASSGASVSSSSGGAICGNGICEPPTENTQFCPQDCSGPASSSSSSGAGGGNPMCSHPACDTGSKLDPSCDPCAATVCASDPYCCDNNWDGQCVGEADQQCGACCGNSTCNNGEDCKKCPQDCGGACPQAPTCKHSVCAVAEALDPMGCRNPCVDMVCAQDPSCCMGPWQDKCGVLAAGCGADPCVSAVCAAMPSCCSSMWSQACVDQAKTSCATPCDCTHDICQSGAALTASCSPCAAALCKADDYCCNNNWDNICVGEVGSVCGILCP